MGGRRTHHENGWSLSHRFGLVDQIQGNVGIALQFHGLVFPAPGDYRVQLSVNDVPLREARLMLIKTTTPPGSRSGHPRPPQSKN